MCSWETTWQNGLETYTEDLGRPEFSTNRPHTLKEEIRGGKKRHQTPNVNAKSKNEQRKIYREALRTKLLLNLKEATNHDRVLKESAEKRKGGRGRQSKPKKKLEELAENLQIAMKKNVISLSRCSMKQKGERKNKKRGSVWGGRERRKCGENNSQGNAS